MATQLNQKLVDIVTGKTRHPLFDELLKKHPRDSCNGAPPEKISEVLNDVFATLMVIEEEEEEPFENLVIIEVSGGVVQRISSTIPVRILILDKDEIGPYRKTINGEMVNVLEHDIFSDQEYCDVITKQLKE